VGLVTEWQEYLDLDWARVVELMRGNLVVDGRNCLDGEAIAGHGGVYLSMGRRAIRAPSAVAETAVPTVAPSLPLG
jgi:UDPglucose 6-dehydrogenase